MEIPDRLRIEVHRGRQIIFVDYNGLKEKEMIALVKSHLALTLDAKLPFLADFSNCYVSPQYMVHARLFVEGTKKIIDRGALIGIDPIKAWILKGIVYFYKVNFRAFESVEKAIDFLSDETKL
jgi:hypothetical protein